MARNADAADLAKELANAMRDQVAAQNEVFFASNGWVLWGDPTPKPDSFGFFGSDRAHLLRTDAAQLLVEQLNRTIASARSLRISECEERVRQAKAALLASLQS